MMKFIKYAFSLCLFTLIAISCVEDDNLDYAEEITAPTNVTAAVSVTQDNTGTVTITPLAEGAVSYTVSFGDGSEEVSDITPGNGAEHIYEEGTYEATITAVSLNGLTTTVTQSVLVSFKAPENLVVIIDNDAAISKQVNLSATADFATMYEVYFGESTDETPVVLNLEETISYQYEEAGTYTIKVIAKSAAIETTEYSEEFVVTAILQPLTGAPVPFRAQTDVVSIYSDVYTDPDPIDYYPNWGQTTTYTQIAVDGNNMIQYGDITYQGIDFNGAALDASAMEFIHVDVWTADADFDAKMSPISAGPNETAITLELNQDQWTSFDIPLSSFTDQNPLVDFSNIIQFKFEGAPSGAGTIFIDNLYFYKESATGISGVLPLTFESGFTLDQFDGGGTSVIANPDSNGNTSSTVLELVKGAGQTWAGSKVTIPTPFDFSSSTTITAKVWSPRAGLNLLMKFEDVTPWPNTQATAEITATTTLANQWETVAFDFAGVDMAVEYYNMVLIMDNGTVGDGSVNYTIYVDDISSSPMLTFEPEYTLDQFDGGGTSVIANPDSNGNTSANVLELVKGAGQPWAGSKITVPTQFDFTAGTTITAKVWSPRAGLNLLMKFEDVTPWPNTIATAEIIATTTLVNQWETLTFDFSSVDMAVEYYNMVLIMDNGITGDGTANYTIYVDDIAQN
ncbi:PKD domain-containing protein [Algibacter sp. L4_22]|uniref:PKD domain-containing protein n=1 Tax=Algibacter sp. L4_22 TaxID=2942477 RepID=UPI00201B7CAE|nr:PKD domain-containing protein [Algibacter sp. L4_22]MCL5127340.1 PKD domain-containing protein [Algibacter sp. L4_22]